MTLNLNMVLAADFSSKAEITKALRTFSQELEELLDHLRCIREDVGLSVTAAGLSFDNEGKISPQYPRSPQVRPMDSENFLVKNKFPEQFSLIKELRTLCSAIQALEQRIESAYSGPDSVSLVADARSLISKAESGIRECLHTISSLSGRHRPSSLKVLSETVSKVFECALYYDSCVRFSYYWTTDDKAVFSDVYMFTGLVDSNSKLTGTVGLTMSVVLGEKPEFYCGLVRKLSEPSPAFLDKKVSTLKDVLSAYESLMKQVRIQTQISKVPVKLFQDNVDENRLRYDPDHILRIGVPTDMIKSFEVDYRQFKFCLKEYLTLPWSLHMVIRDLFRILKPITLHPEQPRLVLEFFDNDPHNMFFVIRVVVNSTSQPAFQLADFECFRDCFNLTDSQTMKVFEKFHRNLD